MHKDAALIKKYGGPTNLARLLGFTSHRVQNWMQRGIPAAVKVSHPDLFINVKRKQRVYKV